MTHNQEETLHLDLIGKKIAGILCHKYYRLNNAVIIQNIKGKTKVVELSSLSKKVKLFTINNEEIEHVEITSSANMFLFHTKKKKFLVNSINQIVEDSDQWKDSYFDVLANSFYRKDALGYWYDIEGFRLPEKIFLKGDILTSLETKKSKKSISFINQEIYISKNKQLIQIGKLVLNLNLEVVKYFGDKVTGLGQINIAFHNDDVLQEVKLGLSSTAFINEFTHEPFLYKDTKIIKHLATHHYGQKRVVIFQTEEETYGVEGRSNNFLTYNGKALNIDANNHLNFKGSELIKVDDGENNFYFDLNSYKPFHLPALNKKICNIEREFVRINNAKVYNASNKTEQFVIREDTGSIFTLDNDTIAPQRIVDIEKLGKYYAFAQIDGQQKLFSKKENKVFKFGRDGLEVSELTYNTNDKFISALDTNGTKLVLDLRFGFEDICLAEVDGDKVSEIHGSAIPIGNKILLNVLVEKLGGVVKRVININEKSLSYFTLPARLKQVSDQDLPSVFAKNFLTEIKFTEEITLENRKFINALFQAFTGKEYPIILEKESGQPLHLEGLVHRNELATKWVMYTLENKFYLGENRMVGVHTISEDQKENKLLFSVQKLTSWLPFFNNYLPIFKQIIEVDDEISNSWDYNLFELREVSNDKEYLAVEKVAPYRVLVDKKGSDYHPRIVKSKKKSIRSPEDLTALQRFFYVNPGVLVEVE